ncbi:hypothetical protein A2634_05525 [Candidatus Amesbacteria bacterium RIFCSPHIGHO2_01_FULL_48_32]|uniref:RNase P protein n=1 Tax=Candidatus Amesbacteria bacterium RIFCSPLOWO2_01_FULL_48_25 TaxID=1797259 RepID=A0A1F4ZB07_9BACT|nr:MAG: hypothetical protein A2634_05525 [Candidatus Amesbacteria bacterium RIFCSPHIGHO2_01_FULL_48_32]OGD03413.1 MAG: hypothetical protein A2989_01100 [Candidatus Amesbacteria bacterium RIFCSPLOWO2_01_FULL_48_25]HJZ05030.1 ribonuclease P protein component [Patescibacteria group bacterium]
MLPKSRRLSRKDFLIAKSQGKTYKFFHFSATVYLTSPQPSPTAKTRAKGEKLGKGERSSGEVFPRFAIVTSSRLHKLAVVRNRLRRRIYDQLKNWSTGQLVNCIIYPHPSMLNLNNEEISAALNSFLSKVTPT